MRSVFATLLASIVLTSATSTGTVDGATTFANVPVATLGAPEAAVYPNTTLALSSHGGGPHSDVAQDNPAYLYLCSGTDCGGTCTFANLLGIPFDNCLGTNAFTSVIIEQAADSGLSFSVYVGPTGCESWAQIPSVNTCYNINGGPWTQYEIIDS